MTGPFPRRATPPLVIDTGLESEVTHALHQARQLLRDVRLGSLTESEASTALLKVRSAAEDLRRSLRSLEDRLTLVSSLASEAEDAIVEGGRS